MAKAKNMHKKQLHPQYIIDTAGKKLVIIPQEEFDSIIEELEVQEDIALYEKAKKEDDGERILFSDYLKNRKKING
jgi:PHD/YefM family antitoxin component YafN of YafNO toxin-antitoxin module